MWKSIYALLLCLFSLQMNGQIENDKVLHFAGGALFGTAGAGLGREITGGKPFSAVGGAIVVSTAVGAAKEAIDASRENGAWDNQDLLFTSLGGLVAGLVVEIFSRKEPKWRVARIEGAGAGTLYRTAGIDGRGQRDYIRRVHSIPLPAEDTGELPRYLENIGLIGL